MKKCEKEFQYVLWAYRKFQENYKADAMAIALQNRTSGFLMSCWETLCINIVYNVHLHPTFSSNRFNCLMLCTNFHFSSLFNATVWWRSNAIVLGALFQCSHQFSITFVICVVKKEFVCSVYKPSIQKVKWYDANCHILLKNKWYNSNCHILL